MRALALHGVMPGNRPPAPYAVRLVASPVPFRPAAYRPQLGQPPGPPPEFNPDMSKEEMVKLASDLMVRSGEEIALELRKTYNQFSYLAETSLLESAASWFAGGPIGFALDTWWQSSRSNHAVLKLQSVRALAQEWINSMTQEDPPGWLRQFNPLIDEVNPALYAPVSRTFDKVVVEMSKVIDLTRDMTQLPANVIAQGIGTFFSSVSEDVSAIARVLRAILKALGAIVEAAVEWPWIAGTAVVLLLGVWLVRG